MNKLHPGAKWHFRVTGYFLFGVIMLFFGAFLAFPLLTLVVSAIGFSIASVGVTIVFAILLYILFILVISEIYAQMSYNRWFYEFNKDGLRLERGIIWKRYSNVPYERIQNVDIHRGIIARMVGFSSLMIQTAGYSANPQSEGYIPALGMHEAEKLREFVMKKVTGRK